MMSLVIHSTRRLQKVRGRGEEVKGLSFELLFSGCLLWFQGVGQEAELHSLL